MDSGRKTSDITSVTGRETHPADRPETLQEFNGRTILELCELGEKILDLYAADIRKQGGR